MDYCEFLTGLFEEGRVAAPRIAPLSSAMLEAGDLVLARYEQVARLEMPEPAPEFDLAAARWGAERMLRACQFVLFRELDEQSMRALLVAPFPGVITAAAHYSVDLTFRYLPDVARFATAVARSDPLVDQLHHWAREWPLSSVGMKLNELADLGLGDEHGAANVTFEIDGFADHPGLLRLYADRIVARGDQSRLADPAARNAVRQCLGGHPELAPAMAAALQQFELQGASA